MHAYGLGVVDGGTTGKGGIGRVEGIGLVGVEGVGEVVAGTAEEGLRGRADRLGCGHAAALCCVVGDAVGRLEVLDGGVVVAHVAGGEVNHDGVDDGQTVDVAQRGIDSQLILLTLNQVGSGGEIVVAVDVAQLVVLGRAQVDAHLVALVVVELDEVADVDGIEHVVEPHLEGRFRVVNHATIGRAGGQQLQLVAALGEEGEREVLFHRQVTRVFGALVDGHGVARSHFVGTVGGEYHAVLRVFEGDFALDGRLDREGFAYRLYIHIPVEVDDDGGGAVDAVGFALHHGAVREHLGRRASHAVHGDVGIAYGVGRNGDVDGLFVVVIGHYFQLVVAGSQVAEHVYAVEIGVGRVGDVVGQQGDGGTAQGHLLVAAVLYVRLGAGHAAVVYDTGNVAGREAVGIEILHHRLGKVPGLDVFVVHVEQTVGLGHIVVVRTLREESRDGEVTQHAQAGVVPVGVEIPVAHYVFTGLRPVGDLVFDEVLEQNLGHHLVFGFGRILGVSLEEHHGEVDPIAGAGGVAVNREEEVGIEFVGLAADGVQVEVVFGAVQHARHGHGSPLAFEQFAQHEPLVEVRRRFPEAQRIALGKGCDGYVAVVRVPASVAGVDVDSQACHVFGLQTETAHEGYDEYIEFFHGSVFIS